MNTAKLFLFFSVILGLTTASPTFAATSARREPPSPSLADDHHLCTGPDYVEYEYGNETYQDSIRADCEKLSQKLKTQTDEQGNFTEFCGRPARPQLFGKEGYCTMELSCHMTTEGSEVTMGYGDIADIIKLATDGLQGSGQPDKSNIVGVRTAFSCPHLSANWYVGLDRSGSAA